MGSNRTRRQLLGVVGTGATLLLAGCTDAGLVGTEPPTGTRTATGTDAATETPTETTEETTAEPEEPAMSTVFHFSKPPEEQRHAVANVANLLADDTTPVDQTVLVANGKGIYLLTETDSQYPEKVRELAEQGVSFRACQNSMAALDVAESDLLDVVETVPAGVGELTKLQAREGFAYIETP
ncbi:DsrE family protein [Haloarchaeobius amylolyticus]|uniref:DsrE family protein n=1 Tax=Haloarchaeobius amylolyticus TaxID=1198296 RepID=UPI002270EC68|nr:DsrE family protein [Haloarchaeobius amylolyticus]